MRFLVICHKYPGRMSPIVHWLAGNPDNEVVLATNRYRFGYKEANVRRVNLKEQDRRPVLENSLDYWIEAAITGKKALSSLKQINNSDFVPDIILVSTGNGSALGLRDIFPSAFIVNYLEPGHSKDFRKVEIWQRLQIIQSIESNLIFSFADSCGFELARQICKPITYVPMCVDTDYFLPVSGKKRDSIIINLRNFNMQKKFMLLGKILESANNYVQCKKIVILAHNVMRQKILDYISSMTAIIDKEIDIECDSTREADREIYAKALLYISLAPEMQMETLEAMSCEVPVMTNPKAGILEGHGTSLDISKLNSISALFGNMQELDKMATRARKYLVQNLDYKKIMPVHIGQIMASFNNHALSVADG